MTPSTVRRTALKVKCQTYTVTQAAALVGVSRQVYTNMIHAGQAPGMRAGQRRWIVAKRQLEKWLDGEWESGEQGGIGR